MVVKFLMFEFEPGEQIHLATKHFRKERVSTPVNTSQISVSIYLIVLRTLRAQVQFRAGVTSRNGCQNV